MPGRGTGGGVGACGAVGVLAVQACKSPRPVAALAQRAAHPTRPRLPHRSFSHRSTPISPTKWATLSAPRCCKQGPQWQLVEWMGGWQARREAEWLSSAGKACQCVHACVTGCRLLARLHVLAWRSTSACCSTSATFGARNTATRCWGAGGVRATSGAGTVGAAAAAVPPATSAALAGAAAAAAAAAAPASAAAAAARRRCSARRCLIRSTDTKVFPAPVSRKAMTWRRQEGRAGGWKCLDGVGVPALQTSVHSTAAAPPPNPQAPALLPLTLRVLASSSSSS